MTMKRIIVTTHAKKRLREERQQGIALDDVLIAARELPGTIPTATRFRGFLSAARKPYDLVAKDIGEKRFVITIIGKQP